jgi:hypothetical protein
MFLRVRVPGTELVMESVTDPDLVPVQHKLTESPLLPGQESSR